MINKDKTKVGYWVANQICNCRDFKERVSLLSTFIALANVLFSFIFTLNYFIINQIIK